MDPSLDRISLPAGSLLFKEGEVGSCAYLINSGAIEIFLSRQSGEVVLANRGPGEIVGEMAIIDHLPRSASARVVADCVLVIVSAEQIAHRIAETDAILRMCLDVVITRYRETIAMFDKGDRRQTLRPDAASSPDEFKAAVGMLSLESELRRALQREEFELYFQPIVRLSSRRLAGFEALLRWRHPTRGLVLPGEFIPIAEASGLIVDITKWCLSQVGATFPQIMAAALQNVGAVEPLFMSVNISGHDLALRSFAESVADVLKASGVTADRIKLEITESVLMKDPSKAVAVLEACRRLGLAIAIDDFGTGYSSLSYLSTLPITTLKIDRSFVSSMMEKPASRKIVQMILRLAAELDIPVVAEGIERPSEEQLLGELGCALAQGYLFGRPAPIAKTIALTRNWVALESLQTAAPVAKIA